MDYKKIKGTNDFFDENSKKFRYVEQNVRKIIESYDFNEIITPIFEGTEVFVRSAGETSDIVNKEMYTFKDKGDTSLTLRPEGTAGVVRSYVENKMYAQPGLKKLYYIGPMFRSEKPQAGRFRQFHQFGIEVFGEGNYLLDAEVIGSAYNIFEALGIKNVKLVINSIGDMESRQNYAKILQEYFKDHLDSLCDDCKKRFLKNPMRILDCKVDKNNPVLINAPKIYDNLTEESKLYFSKLLNALEKLGIDYRVDHNLVRGLDYYTDTVFEYIIEDNSEISGLAICAGGKYADLIRSFGGPDVPGVGYAFGVERIISIMDNQGLFKDNQKTKVTLITLDEESKIYGMSLAKKLRQEFIVNMDYKNNNLKPQFKLSDRSQSDYVIIIGEEERLNNEVTVKNAKTAEQNKIKVDQIISYIKGE